MQHRRAVNAVQRNASRLARRAGEPASLSTGSLTAAEGCVQWYNVKTGDSCYSAIATVEGGLSLEDFYAMNPQVDNDCFNLWKGYDYCVSRSECAKYKFGQRRGGSKSRFIAQPLPRRKPIRPLLPRSKTSRSLKTTLPRRPRRPRRPRSSPRLPLRLLPLPPSSPPPLLPLLHPPLLPNPRSKRRMTMRSAMLRMTTRRMTSPL